jgi:hypothetical protein
MCILKQRLNKKINKLFICFYILKTVLRIFIKKD